MRGYDITKIHNTINYKFIASTLGFKFLKPELYNAAGVIGQKSGFYWEGRFALVQLHVKHPDIVGGELVFNEVVCKVTGKKNIVQTIVQGLKGTIKEYISDLDFDIELTGAVVSTDERGNVLDEYPADGVRNLEAMCAINDSLEVYSEFLKLFNITHVVVYEREITQQTYSNRQEFKIKCYSDIPFEIKQAEI